MKKTFGIAVKIIFILFLLAFILLLIPIKSNTINRFILLPFEEKFSKTLQFETSRIWLPGNIFLKGVCASDKSGAVCRAETVNIDYNIAAILLGKKEILFSAKDVKFYSDIALLNSVSRVLTIQKMPNVDFRTIEGDFAFHKNTVHVKKVAAANDNMVISGNGWINKDGSLDCAMHFSFSKLVTDTIPDIVKTTLLSDENKGWMGITLKTTGNYARPSLHIDSDTFKMNIKESIIKIK